MDRDEGPTAMSEECPSLLFLFDRVQFLLDLAEQRRDEVPQSVNQPSTAEADRFNAMMAKAIAMIRKNTVEPAPISPANLARRTAIASASATNPDSTASSHRDHRL